MVEKTILKALDFQQRILLDLLTGKKISENDLKSLVTLNEEVKNKISEKKDDLELNKIIIKYLKDLKIPENTKGYKYIKYAVMLKITSGENEIQKITKELYPLIATKFNTTWVNVEGAIRHAIDMSWNSGVLKKSFKVKPTNNYFISAIAEDIRMKL